MPCKSGRVTVQTLGPLRKGPSWGPQMGIFPKCRRLEGKGNLSCTVLTKSLIWRISLLSPSAPCPPMHVARGVPGNGALPGRGAGAVQGVRVRARDELHRGEPAGPE